MRSSRTSKRKDVNNDYLETPRTNRQSLKEKEKLSEDIKAKYIQQLEQRNRKLKYEIIKINEMLEEHQAKPQKKQHKLIPHDSSAEVVKKQLENVYKQIKNYQRQIGNLQQRQAGGLLTDKMARLQNIYAEKTAHLEKLKNELSQLTKVSLQNSKKLKNNAGKQQLQHQMLKYNEQIKLLRQKVRQAETRQKKKMQNAKKQFDYIKKLQRQLIQNGVSVEELQDMKRNNIYNHIYDKINNKDKNENSQENLQKIEVSRIKKQQKEQIEQLTVDRYLQMKNEVKLYKKLHLDYDKRLQALDKQRVAQQKTLNVTKAKLKQKQQEIEKIQQEISELKGRVKKVNNASLVSKSKDQSKDKKKPIPKQRILPPQKKVENQQLITNSATQQTHLKYDQKGQATDKGARFTDRTVLGKTFNSKIVGMKVWTQKSTFQITGVQCIYKINDQVKSGIQYIAKQCKPQCTQILMQLPDGDYVKSISGNLSQNNIVEYLVVMSKDSQITRFGVVKPTQKQFNFDIDEDEIPVCIYGSLYKPRDSKQCSLIEQLGFQIMRDKNFIKDDKFV